MCVSALWGIVCAHCRVGVKAMGGVGGGLDLPDASQRVLGDSGEWEGPGISSRPGEAVVEYRGLLWGMVGALRL